MGSNDDYYDEEDGFDLGLRRNLRNRKIRRWIIMVTIVVAFLDIKGMPHVRLTDPERTPRHAIQYWSVTGTRQFHGPNTPLIVLIPMEHSVFHTACAVAADLWRSILELANLEANHD